MRYGRCDASAHRLPDLELALPMAELYADVDFALSEVG